MNRLKALILTAIMVGGFILVPKIVKNHKNEAEVSDTTYAVYAMANTDPIGEVKLEPTVFDVLKEGGYTIANKNLERTLSSHEFEFSEENAGRMTADANFRSGPGIEYDIIKELQEDTNFTVLACSDNGWYLVDYQGSLGFICKDYVETYNPEALNEAMCRMPRIVHGVRAYTDVNIRSGPSTDSEIIGVLDRTFALPAGDPNSDQWIPVSYQGRPGFVYGGYINGEKLVSDTTVIEGSWTEMVDVIHECSIYNRPYGEATGTIPQYQTAKVYGEVEDYYYVDADGQYGYVRKSDCAKVTDTYVVIDYSMDKLFFYRGNEKIFSSYVVLGGEGKETPLGCHQVLQKLKDTVLVGEDYAVPVDYFVRFVGQCGIHDAPWRGAVFGYDDTHGCTNAQHWVAETCYNDLQEGDTVIVQR